MKLILSDITTAIKHNFLILTRPSISYSKDIQKITLRRNGKVYFNTKNDRYPQRVAGQARGAQPNPTQDQEDAALYAEMADPQDAAGADTVQPLEAV